jgi:hypothetical protein
MRRTEASRSKTSGWISRVSITITGARSANSPRERRAGKFFADTELRIHAAATGSPRHLPTVAAFAGRVFNREHARVFYLCCETE